MSSPVPHGHQLITVDVLSPLHSTQANSAIAQVTPIALLKLEPTYIQGTTIAVAGFIAYSMTRGRVRLIGRQSGARAMLRLPATFPPNASVQDMVINGTKLACVTNDGGLVVWDVPGEIEDDVQSRIFVHVLPSPDLSAFKTVKWHPKQPNILAVASEREIYLLNVDEAMQVFGGEGIRQDELGRISQVFTIMSPLISFTFDIPQIALASVSVDSTVTLWSMHDQTPFWSSKILGEGIPSSIDFLEGGLVIGRRQGNVLQFVPVMSTTVVSTIRFVLGSRSDVKDAGNEKEVRKREEEEESLMFGHLTYDPTMKTLWVANSARSSLFAMKMGVEAIPPPINQDSNIPILRPVIDQIVEFPCSMPSINLTIVAAEPPAPPGTSLDAIASWAKDPSLAVSAFCVHAGGVDQINIELDAYDGALTSTQAKFPSLSYEPAPFGKEDRRTSSQSQSSFNHAPPPAFTSSSQVRNDPYIQPQLPLQQQPPMSSPERYGAMVPLDNIQATLQQSASYQSKGKAKETAPNNGANISKSTARVANIAPPNGNEPYVDNSVTSALTKEIKKVEDSLHTKIGRLIVKELDKQQSRLEEVRIADQNADFERQEKILKLISTELTKNTTRVVEQAVKSVVQNSVLPALENVTKSEIKIAMNTQISKGISESLKQSLPAEIERVLLRTEVTSLIARTLSGTVVPLIEHQVKDLISRELVPAYTEAAGAVNQDMLHEVRSEILTIKQDVASWQNESLKGTENLIRDMDQTIRNLAEQVKMLSAQVASHSTSAPSDYSVIRPSNPPSTTSSFASYPQYHAAPNPSVSVPSWMNSHPAPSHNIPAPAVQPQPQPQVQSPPQATTSTIRTEDWDDTFLANLGQQDPRKLRELLQKCQPDVIMPSGGQTSPLSQAVILTLIHRLAMSLPELAPVDDAFKLSMWWLQRASYSLNPSDNVIAPYLGRVLQTAVASLNTTTQRLNLLPGGPSLAETNNTLGQIQQNLSSLMPATSQI